MLSVIVDEAVRDFSYIAWLFFIPFALVITVREVVGSQRGIEKERKVWMEFYETQLSRINSGEEFEIDHIVGDKTSDSYVRTMLKALLYMLRNPLLLVLHFVVWVYTLVMFIFLFSLGEGIVEASNNFVKSILQDGKHAIFFALISSFREARGYFKGIASERQIWMKWYDRQLDNIKFGDSVSNPLASVKVRCDSYFKKIQNSIRLIYSDSTHFGIQFALWCIIFATLSFPSFGYSINPTYISLIGSFVIPGMIVTFLISYRKARGIIKGRDKEQQVWVHWCQQQKISMINETVAENPPKMFEELDDSYLQTVKKTVSILLRNPITLVIHLISWIIVFIVMFGVTDWFWVVEWYSDLTQFVIVLSLAIVSYYQETKGGLIGITSERQVWTEWYCNENIVKTGISPLDEVIYG